MNNQQAIEFVKQNPVLTADFFQAIGALLNLYASILEPLKEFSPISLTTRQRAQIAQKLWFLPSFLVRLLIDLIPDRVLPLAAEIYNLDKA